MVLDPFSGSGTTAIEALNNGREFIGFEISKEYYEKSIQRIRNETAQMSIFDIADCKTENSSEKPNNCETCKYGEDKHRYAHICNECGVGINNYKPKDEPTISKMEQVDKDINVRSKDEPKLSEIPTSKCHYEPTDEPQTERSE